MEDWQRRVEEEETELAAKPGRLRTFIDAQRAPTREDELLLMEQAQVP